MNKQIRIKKLRLNISLWAKNFKRPFCFHFSISTGALAGFSFCLNILLFGIIIVLERAGNECAP